MTRYVKCIAKTYLSKSFIQSPIFFFFSTTKDRVLSLFASIEINILIGDTIKLYFFCE